MSSSAKQPSSFLFDLFQEKVDSRSPRLRGPMMNWPRPQHKATNRNQLTLCQVPWVTAFMAGAAGRGPKSGLHNVGITGAEIRPLSSRTYDKHHHESHLSWARQTRIDSTDKQLKALSGGPSSSSSYGPTLSPIFFPTSCGQDPGRNPFPLPALAAPVSRPMWSRGRRLLHGPEDGLASKPCTW